MIGTVARIVHPLSVGGLILVIGDVSATATEKSGLADHAAVKPSVTAYINRDVQARQSIYACGT